MTEVAGVILAGGLSRRMGGGDKALRSLGGKPVLDHVIARARAQVGPLVLNANGDPARFEAFGLPVAPDLVEGFAGPLAGVLTGLAWAQAEAPDCDWLASFACDAPFLPEDLVARLLAAVEAEGADLACAASRGRSHPVFGLWPLRLRAELEADENLTGQRLPPVSGIANFLKEQGLTRTYERHSELPQPKPQPAGAPHEEWEMDSRGQERVPDVGIIALINLCDEFSKAKIRSYPCVVGQKRATRRPRTEDYQLVLRLSFTEWGLPDRIAVDHDSVFYDNTCKSPFPTRFHLWLLALGVDLAFGRPGRPTRGRPRAGGLQGPRPAQSQHDGPRRGHRRGGPAGQAHRRRPGTPRAPDGGVAEL